MLTRRTLLGAISAIALLSAGGAASAQEAYDIALISKGFQHQFWQAVKAGADQAAADLGVTVTFEGPESETQVDRQMDMLAAALSRGPDAIAAVVIGGTSLSGGRGTVLGTLIGALIISVLANGLRILSVAQEWQTVVTGSIIILAVYADILRRRTL